MIIQTIVPFFACAENIAQLLFGVFQLLFFIFGVNCGGVVLLMLHLLPCGLDGPVMTANSLGNFAVGPYAPLSIFQHGANCLL